jgi:uncharacterized protein involved in cysteine biosynthesis
VLGVSSMLARWAGVPPGRFGAGTARLPRRRVVVILFVLIPTITLLGLIGALGVVLAGQPNLSLSGMLSSPATWGMARAMLLIGLAVLAFLVISAFVLLPP